MTILGIESSCDECAAAVVQDGKKILSNIVATQIPFHAEFQGVVPEIASRKHTEWIAPVVLQALSEASLSPADIDGVAVTSRPGLLGSLMVGVSFAKAFSWGLGIPFIAVDHMRAHLYAPQLIEDLEYPYLGLLVSGGHTIICRVDGFDEITVLGTTIDDAAGEAFDKVSRHYGMGYPGGVYIDRLAKNGDAEAFRFPLPNLHKGAHPCDVSYSGLKTAVINQLEQFRRPGAEISLENIAASFQKAAVNILLRAVLNAVKESDLRTIVAGGGVAANSYLRESLAAHTELRCIFPPLDLCGDNAAMVAGLGYQYLLRGDRSALDAVSSARVPGFKRRYP